MYLQTVHFWIFEVLSKHIFPEVQTMTDIFVFKTSLTSAILKIKHFYYMDVDIFPNKSPTFVPCVFCFVFYFVLILLSLCLRSNTPSSACYSAQPLQTPACPQLILLAKLTPFLSSLLYTRSASLHLFLTLIQPILDS